MCKLLLWSADASAAVAALRFVLLLLRGAASVSPATVASWLPPLGKELPFARLLISSDCRSTRSECYANRSFAVTVAVAAGQ
jgi:hypothetical protein